MYKQILVNGLSHPHTKLTSELLAHLFTYNLKLSESLRITSHFRSRLRPRDHLFFSFLLVKSLPLPGSASAISSAFLLSTQQTSSFLPWLSVKRIKHKSFSSLIVWYIFFLQSRRSRQTFFLLPLHSLGHLLFFLCASREKASSSFSH